MTTLKRSGIGGETIIDPTKALSGSEGEKSALTDDTDEEVTPDRADPEGITFHDLLDVEEMQRIQDAFASAAGVASIITDTEGRPITRPSNFCRLCGELIRRTPKGLANCMRSDAALGRANADGPTVSPCLSGGLWDGAAAICVGKRRIGIWLVGQVRDETQDDERMLAYAREIGVDETRFREALAEVPRMSRERFGEVCRPCFSSPTRSPSWP